MAGLKLRSYKYRVTFLGAPKPPIIKRPLMVAAGTFNTTKPEEAAIKDLMDHLAANGIQQADIKSCIVTELDQAISIPRTIEGEAIN